MSARSNDNYEVHHHLLCRLFNVKSTACPQDDRDCNGRPQLARPSLVSWGHTLPAPYLPAFPLANFHALHGIAISACAVQNLRQRRLPAICLAGIRLRSGADKIQNPKCLMTLFPSFLHRISVNNCSFRSFHLIFAVFPIGL